jgi:hypothetical protein
MAIINDNDMEIILKGDQETAIREMLRERFFALLKMPVKKQHTSPVSSSVFVGHMHGWSTHSLAIRKKGCLTVFEDCEYYLSIYHLRGNEFIERDGSCVNLKDLFDRSIERIAFPGTEVMYPSVDEFLAFMADKELVCLTNYIEHHNMEIVKSRHFLNNYMLMRENYDKRYFRHDDYHDVRLFLTRVEEEGAYAEHGLYPDDIRLFDVKDKIINYLRKISEECFCDKSDYYYEYESQSPEIRAVYFATRFHSNPAWDANPVNLFNFRICTFVLRGTISPKKAKKLPLKKKTMKTECSSEYVIDSIHLNSNICFDLAEFKDLLKGLFYEVFMD